MDIFELITHISQVILLIILIAMNIDMWRMSKEK